MSEDPMADVLTRAGTAKADGNKVLVLVMNKEIKKGLLAMAEASGLRSRDLVTVEDFSTSLAHGGVHIRNVFLEPAVWNLPDSRLGALRDALAKLPRG